VIALDYSSEALQITQRLTQHKAQIVQADLVHDELSQKFSDKKFAAVFSDGLFEHFNAGDQDRILKNFYTVLKEDGLILTFVPNRWSPWQLIRPFLMPGIQERPLTLTELKVLHERNGFRIAASGGLNVFPFRFSPEFLGAQFGMLLYVIAKKRKTENG
jgi:SAM-dependent methyltransferase